RFIEMSSSGPDLEEGWELLARLCRADEDVVGEVLALAALCELPSVELNRVSRIANRVNELLRAKGGAMDSDEKRMVVRRLAPRLRGNRRIQGWPRRAGASDPVTN